jgi:hypothetical protein
LPKIEASNKYSGYKISKKKEANTYLSKAIP